MIDRHSHAAALPAAFHASFLANCQIPGMPRVALAPPELTGQEIGEAVRGFHSAAGEIKSFAKSAELRIADLEQKAARHRYGGGGPVAPKTLGQLFVEADEFKSIEGKSERQFGRISVRVGNDPLERKSVTSAVGSGASLISPDIRVNDPSLLPWNVNAIRSLVAPGQTSSNAVFYPRMTGRMNAAAPVAEGALKPQSDAQFEQVMAPVQTLAHYFLVTRQAMDDAPALASIIDAEARGGLKDVEDAQLLFGDGTGQNLHGLVPQASPFAKQWNAAISSGLDVLIQAVAQVEAGNYACDGMVLNTVDWRQLQSVRDGQGRYIGNSPFDAEVLKRIWSTPVALTNRMPRGKFLVGPFRSQAQIFDRMDVEVLLSTEDSDNFRRNLVTARCEERLAFTVKRPTTFVYGDLSTNVSGS